MNISEKAITIYDIAKIVNLSPATVSRSLSDDPSVNHHTKRRIVELAESLGYHSNQMAANLRRKRSNIIGVIVPRLNSSFMSDVIAGIQSALNKANYNLIITQSYETLSKEMSNAKDLYTNRVDGLLVSLTNETTDLKHFKPFSDRNIPVIYFDKSLGQPGLKAVVIDNFSAAYNITNHLIEQGCKRIVHVTTKDPQSVYLDRLNGYRQALSDHSLPMSTTQVVASDLSLKGSVDVVDSILSLKKMPDGIFATNDSCAVNCILGLKRHGIHVPKDVAVAGFNNDPVSWIVEPNLTTIDYSGSEIGKHAAEMLLQSLTKENGETKMIERIVLKGNMVLRNSSLKNEK